MTIEAHLRLTRGTFVLDADLETPSRGVTAIFGPSGSGKTTLLRAIAGLEPSAAGTLRVGDEVWQDADVARPPHRRRIGYVFQEPSLFEHLSVRRNLAYGLKRTPAAERSVSFAEASSLLGLAPLLDRASAELSGGERQRVAIARALLTGPRLLLMDEPLSGLDDDSKATILPYLERLHETLEIPVLYVSHSADEVARFADRVALLDRGRIIASGPIAEMMTRLDLPLTRGDAANAVIEARVIGRDEAYQLTELEFSGGRLAIAESGLEPGRYVRLRVLARDVSLTLERQSGTSILNIVPVKVEEISDPEGAQVLVRLDAGGTPLLARVTRRSAAGLELVSGKAVFAQVKTVALLR